MVLYFILILIITLGLSSYVVRHTVNITQFVHALRNCKSMDDHLKDMPLGIVVSKKNMARFMKFLEQHTRIDKDYRDNFVVA